jgi:FtsP/CotA-like multicopper oxidase with cupredoxin domain
MFEETVVKDQAGEENGNDSSGAEGVSDGTRRAFLQYSMMAASGLALTSLLPPVVAKMWAVGLQTQLCPSGQALQDIMEIKSKGTTLQAVLKVLSESRRTYPTSPTTTGEGPMRYLSGFDVNDPGQVWPKKKGVPSPAPTLRAKLGDRVQITLLNHVDIKDFPQGGLDVAETGGGCDSATVAVANINTYPGKPSFEKPPNCFHGSSSTNLHFHGSHVSPSGISDNVLLTVRPSPRDAQGNPTVNEASVKQIFDAVFGDCAHGKQPLLWSDWPEKWRTWQQELLQTYDKTAAWQGQTGLPQSEQLWYQNQQAMAAKLLPQYYIGAYPTCFTIPKFNNSSDPKKTMGQAPGTHWYHAHKHGSTALNLLNGMAGALIIEGLNPGEYDYELNKFIKKQRVLVLQQYGDTLNLLKAPIAIASPTPVRNSLGPEPVVVNGQLTPCVQMNPNEMQLWRIVNACHQAAVPLNSPTGIKWVQTAQDGVQFDPANYNPGLTNAAFTVPAKSVPPFGSLAPGNRIDLLVQAPSTTGTFQVTYGGNPTSTPPRPPTLLLTVNVVQDPAVPVIKTPMPFPTKAQFPKMPKFLQDISFGDVKKTRELRFKSVADPTVTPAGAMGRGTNAPFPPPIHTIDGKQFNEGKIDQTMQLGDTEEWTLYNDGGAAHPFHIHINPFQVVEIMDPKQNGGQPKGLPKPWVWWDNFAIPTGGYVKILTRFVDFTGIYVLHCHILGHEDRGMMQMVQVCADATKCPTTTTMTHH